MTTLRFILVNPKKMNMQTFISAIHGLPVRTIISKKVEDIKIIDTGIEVTERIIKNKKGAKNASKTRT